MNRRTERGALDSGFDPKDEHFKKLVKEGIREWLDDQYLIFGRWTLHGVLAAALCGAVYLALRYVGYHK